MTTPAVQHAVDAALREERGRVVAALIRRTGDWDLGRGVRAGGVHRGAAAMAKIEQNGYYSPPLGTPKTMQDGCIAARFLSFAAIVGDSTDRPVTRIGAGS
jgi:hypothetical protein